MKRLLVLLVCACASVLLAEAQYVRVNYDKKTVAAMAAAYATETATEAYYTEQTKPPPGSWPKIPPRPNGWKR